MSIISYIKEPREEVIKKIVSDKIITHELSELLLGDLLGQGANRHVFQSAINKNQVIKIDVSDQNANVMEWETWKKVSHVDAVAGWFAPAVSISRYGTVLVMKKAQTRVDKNKFPGMIPTFFSDVKDNNFGFIGNKFVCIDYSEHLLWEIGMKIKMRKVKW